MSLSTYTSGHPSVDEYIKLTNLSMFNELKTFLTFLYRNYQFIMNTYCKKQVELVC